MPNDNLAAVTNYPQILDGFCYSGLFGVRPLLDGMSWYWKCLANMEDLRLAADSYRPRWWTVPKNVVDLNNPGGENILPGKTFFYEFQVKEGSSFWGMQFAVVGFPLDQTAFSVVVRQGSDFPIADRPMVAAAIFSARQGDELNIIAPPVDLLIRPRLIIDPTQIHVELSNDSTAALDVGASCQLLLLFAEPKS
jgi:hypothetical protein